MHKILNYDEGVELLRLLMKAVDKMNVAEPNYIETLKTAFKYGITFYDAVYVQLAVENSDILVTEDSKLRKKTKGHVKVLSVGEIEKPI